MKKWFQQPVLWLMVSSITLLVLFVGTWLYVTYDKEKNDLKREIDLLFHNTIREIEDSLFRVLISEEIRIVDSSGNGPALVRGHSEPNDTLRSVMVFRKPFSNHFPRDSVLNYTFRRRHERIKRGELAGTISLHLKLNRIDSSFTFNGDSTDESDLLDLLRARYLKTVSETGYRSLSDVIEQETEMTYPAYLVSRPYYDAFNQKEYVATLQKPGILLMKRIVPQILFSLFLLVVTFLAFFLLYRNLLKQQRLNLIKQDLISNITHELKTPITTVHVALEAITDFMGRKDPARTREYLEISKRELGRLALLVENILKTSEINGQEPELQLETVNMSELLEHILSNMKLHFERSGAKVKFKTQGNNFFLSGDQTHLTSVIYNLLDNALKYSNGTPDIAVTLTDRGNDLIMEVQDRGLGIPKEYLPRIFDRFFRVPTGDLHNVKGHGLGLSYVAKVIRQHAGKIDVESEPEKGTKFIVSLPKAR